MMVLGAAPDSIIIMGNQNAGLELSDVGTVETLHLPLYLFIKDGGVYW